MDCPDCRPDRRSFLKTAALGSAAVALDAAPKSTAPTSETLVTTFYKSLTAEQKQQICMPFDHDLRSKVDANWFITPGRVGKFTPDQQQMIKEIWQGLYNPEFLERVKQQVQEDSKGLQNHAVALFGEPGTGKFEFVLTGRHCTVRCDGDSVEGAAFGGPIFYGHQSGPKGTEPADHPGNVYWYQATRANEVFNALDGKQRAQALVVGTGRPETSTSTVKLRRKDELQGIPVADMSADQRGLVEKVLADLLLPYRKKDVDEAMRYIKGNGGVNGLHMAYFVADDLGGDKVWDVWQLESPTMIWYFRGNPHVHTWVNIRQSV
ncbi:MAG: DUF3500 domain-containing protein [Bryobacterales bacterium]|nr:DUF3500 domain-containing protein [Bryobacterales bacterium]